MIEERAILAALERIARMQDSIRSGMDICRYTGLVFLRVYYEQLPPNVARRLTELHAEDMAEIPRATSTEGTAQDRQRLGEKLAVETDRFMQQLKTEGREQYSIGEYVEKVYNPVMNL